MKIAPFLSLLLIATPLIHQPIAQAGMPQIQDSTVVPTSELEAIQALIDQKQYDFAFKEIHRVGRKMNRRSIFDLMTPRYGNSFVSRWLLNLVRAELKAKEYQQAVNLALRTNDYDVFRETITGLYQAKQKPFYEQLIDKSTRKLSQEQARNMFTTFSSHLFQAGSIEESDRFLIEAIRRISSDSSKESQQTYILNIVGISSHSLDRAVQVADRLDISKNSSASRDITYFAVQQGNGAIVDRYISGIQEPGLRASYRYEQSVQYFTQNKTALGLVTLNQSLLEGLKNIDDMEERDNRLEAIALLYQEQKQPKLARAAAQRVYKVDRYKALLAKLK
jgi:flavin-binding protein dodecin